MPRPTNFERVMGVVNSTKGKRAASADIAKALKVPVAKLRGWLLEWASMGLLCVNKGGVVSRKKGTKRKTRAKKWPDVQLDLPFDVIGHPDCPRDRVYMFSKEPTLTPLVVCNLAYRSAALTSAYPDEATVLTGDNPLLNIFKKEDENV